jgi:phosphoribosylformylglycinamidine synthase
MSVTVTQLYRKIDDDRAYCFNIESKRKLTKEEMTCLKLILADGFLLDSVGETPVLQGERVVEVGPRLNFATAWSSNMVSICKATGLDMITRVERSRR